MSARYWGTSTVSAWTRYAPSWSTRTAVNRRPYSISADQDSRAADRSLLVIKESADPNNLRDRSCEAIAIRPRSCMASRNQPAESPVMVMARECCWTSQGWGHGLSPRYWRRLADDEKSDAEDAWGYDSQANHG